MSRKGGHPGHALAVFYGDGHGFQLGYHGGYGHIDAVPDADTVGAGSDVHEAVANDGLGQDHRGGGAVTNRVVGLGGGFFNQLSAKVLVRLREFNLFRHGDAVTADYGQSEHAAEQHVSAAGSQG